MRSRLGYIGRRCRRFGAQLVVVAIAVIATTRVDREHRIEPPAPVTIAWPPWRAAAPPLQLAITPRTEVTARVTAEGEPVADAAVSIRDGSGPPLATARTDRDGLARFADLAPGPYELWATRDGQTSPIARIAATGGAAPLELVLEPAGSVRGEVLADAALPAGATVELVPLEVDHVVRVAALDEHGRFAIDGLPYGRWRIEGNVPGHVQAAEQFVRSAERPAVVEVRLQRTGTVSGTVVDATGEPVANATIVLRDQAGAAGAMQRPFALAPSRVRWVHPLAATRLMPVWKPTRFGAARPGSRPAECGRGHCGVDLGTERGSTVHASADGTIAAVFAESRTEAGRVVAIDHGDGLKTFYMHLDDIREGLEVGQPIEAGDPVGTLGSTGFTRSVPHLHFALTHERAGRTWYLDPEPILRDAVVLAAPRLLDPVDPSAASASAAREPGAAPPAVLHVTTDARGAFHLDGVAPGAYVAGAFALHLAPGASSSFAVQSGEPTTGVLITLRPGVMVHGRVVGRDGPIAGATIIASAGFGETAHKVKTTWTDRHGEFTLRSLSGSVTLAVTAPNHGEVERTIRLDQLDRRRTQRREDFTLTLEDAELRGQVLAPDGGAAAGIAIRVVDGPTRRRAVTDARGQFTLDPVASGRYVVELSSAEYPSKRLALETDRWTELRLDPGGGARCTVRDQQSDAPLAGLRVEARGPGNQRSSRTTDARGQVELRGLVPGNWTLTARGAGYVLRTQRVTIHAGRGPQDVQLELPRGATVAGVVRDRHGRRVAGARVALGSVSALTDADGSFRLAGTASGVLEAEHDGRRGAVSLDLAPGDERLSVTIELDEPQLDDDRLDAADTATR